jgi:hypothetical protein
MLIDDFMPVYDFSEKHDIVIRASAENVSRALETADFSESFIVRWLLRLRGMSGKNITLRSLRDTKFKILAEKLNEEIVIGLAGKFWTPTGAMQDVDAGNFREFDKPGFAKAAWNFAIGKSNAETPETPETPETRDTPGTAGASGALKHDVTIVTTETRIQCMDDTSRSRFGFYWTFIQPFSGWIRNEMLAVVKRKAEGLAADARR